MRQFDMVRKRLVVAILVVLAAGNGAWSLGSGRNAPWVAVVAYTAVAMAVLRSNHYHAGLIVGIAGFTIHAVELAVQGTAGLGPLERAWFAANMILPFLLAWLSWILIRRRHCSVEATDEDGPGSGGDRSGRRE